ncbi:hypothetical protein QJQ45_027399 [Haematococcus lacustris]|nr:hypothetical protein QJQ45_027399 [Haematococcus lacustris]
MPAKTLSPAAPAMGSTATHNNATVDDAVVEAVSGAAGSVLALLATYPLKTIYTIQALSAGNSGAPTLSALDIVLKYRLRGLFVGVEPNIVESALSSGVYFYLYSKLRHLVVSHSKRSQSSPSALNASAGSRGNSSSGSNIARSSSHSRLAAAKLGTPAAAPAHSNPCNAPSCQESTTAPVTHATKPPDGAASFAGQGQQAGGATTAAAAPAPSKGGSSKGKDIGVLSSLLVASLAAAGNQIITMPASVVATRMQAQKKLKMDGHVSPPGASSLGGVISAVFREGGLGGFWAGFLPSLVLITNPSIQYMLYEQFLRLLKTWKAARLAKQAAEAMQGPAAAGEAGGVAPGSQRASSPEGSQGMSSAGVKLGPGTIFTASALAKIGATVATYWLVVVKSRLQAAGKGTPAELQYKGTLDCLRRIWLEEGLSGFFKGLKAKILQTALNAALMLMLKEQLFTVVKRLLASQRLHNMLSRSLVA